MFEAIFSLFIAFVVKQFSIPYFDYYRTVELAKGVQPEVIERSLSAMEFALLASVTMVAYIFGGLLKWLFKKIDL